MAQETKTASVFGRILQKVGLKKKMKKSQKQQSKNGRSLAEKINFGGKFR